MKHHRRRLIIKGALGLARQTFESLLTPLIWAICIMLGLLVSNGFVELLKVYMPAASMPYPFTGIHASKYGPAVRWLSYGTITFFALLGLVDIASRVTKLPGWLERRGKKVEESETRKRVVDKARERLRERDGFAPGRER